MFVFVFIFTFLFLCFSFMRTITIMIMILILVVFQKIQRKSASIQTKLLNRTKKRVACLFLGAKPASALRQLALLQFFLQKASGYLTYTFAIFGGVG